MEFENNEKKHEEPTQQDGFQREVRQGRSPRPRIHTAQRPSFERPNYRQHDDEAVSVPRASVQVCRAIPLSVVAIVLVTTTRVAMVSSVRAVMASVLKVVMVSSARVVIASVPSRAAMVSSARVVTASVPSRAAMVSSARAVTASVPSRVAMVSVLRAVTTSVPSRVVTVSPMAHLIRRDLVSILPTMIRMQSTV